MSGSGSGNRIVYGERNSLSVLDCAVFFLIIMMSFGLEHPTRFSGRHRSPLPC
jgi:hypothetical protein